MGKRARLRLHEKGGKGSTAETLVEVTVFSDEVMPRTIAIGEFKKTLGPTFEFEEL